MLIDMLPLVGDRGDATALMSPTGIELRALLMVELLTLGSEFVIITNTTFLLERSHYNMALGALAAGLKRKGQGCWEEATEMAVCTLCLRTM